MSEARERYLKLIDDIDGTSAMGEAIRNYVTELEQQNAELKDSIKLALSKSTRDGWMWRIFAPVIERVTSKPIDEVIK